MPRLIVAYLPDWTPEVSELALELVRRQRAGGRDLLLRHLINTTMPLPLGHVEVGLHLVHGTLGDRGLIHLNGRHDCGGLRHRGLGQTVE